MDADHNDIADLERIMEHATKHRGYEWRSEEPIEWGSDGGDLVFLNDQEHQHLSDETSWVHVPDGIVYRRGLNPRRGGITYIGPILRAAIVEIDGGVHDRRSLKTEQRNEEYSWAKIPTLVVHKGDCKASGTNWRGVVANWLCATLDSFGAPPQKFDMDLAMEGQK